jgi:hypothetical protein
MFCYLWLLRLHKIFPHELIKDTIIRKPLLDKDMCFDFLYNSYNILILRRIQGDCVRNEHRYSSKVPRFVSFNRTQTRVVIGLLTGHYTLRRHLHIMGLCNHPICRKCATEEKTSVHILCECEALTLLRHAYLGFFFLDPQDIRQLGMGAIWNFAKQTGHL